MELADVTDSKSVGLIPRVGSSPTTGTNIKLFFESCDFKKRQIESRRDYFSLAFLYK